MNDEELNEANELSFGPFAEKPTVELLELLCGDDAVTRHAAATALQRRPDRDVFEQAVALTRTGSNVVRESAIFLLGQLGYRDGYPFRAESAPLLESLLNNDPSGEIRASAAAALGHLQAASARDSLVRALEDEEVRYEAAFALSGMATPEIFPAIEKIRNDPDGDYADWGEIAMELFNWEKYQDEAVESLCTLLADAGLDIAARKSVAEILVGRDEGCAWEQARVFRESDMAALRLNAPLIARWLGGSIDTPAQADLLAMLFDLLRNDADGSVRARTAEVLAEFKGAAALDALIAATGDPAWQVRHSVAFALSRHGAPDGKESLEKLCGDPDERVARYARERRDWMRRTFEFGTPE